MNITKRENCVIKYKYFDCFLEYKSFKDDLMECKCFCCNKYYQHKFDENLKERFFNICKFSNHDNNRFILLLRKVVYSYEYMDNLESVDEKSLPEKEEFCCHFNMENITDANYEQVE